MAKTSPTITKHDLIRAIKANSEQHIILSKRIYALEIMFEGLLDFMKKKEKFSKWLEKKNAEHKQESDKRSRGNSQISPE